MPPASGLTPGVNATRGGAACRAAWRVRARLAGGVALRRLRPEPWAGRARACYLHPYSQPKRKVNVDSAIRCGDGPLDSRRGRSGQRCGLASPCWPAPRTASRETGQTWSNIPRGCTHTWGTWWGGEPPVPFCTLAGDQGRTDCPDQPPQFAMGPKGRLRVEASKSHS